MCWAIPAKLIEVDGNVGRIELEGAVREIGLALVENPQVGDYVLAHAGFAIQIIDEDEAAETLRIWDELAAAGEAAE